MEQYIETLSGKFERLVWFTEKGMAVTVDITGEIHYRQNHEINRVIEYEGGDEPRPAA